jgi:hypothetical protein
MTDPQPTEDRPVTSEEWADYIAKRFGCIHDTQELPEVIRRIRYQAQMELNDIGNFIDEAVNV